jgi:hypothetical protein
MRDPRKERWLHWCEDTLQDTREAIRLVELLRGSDEVLARRELDSLRRRLEDDKARLLRAQESVALAVA